MANLAALRAAVFSLSAKNLRGGVEINPPPPVRGLNPSFCSKLKVEHAGDDFMS